jgi:hypothetical protein
MQKDSEPRQVTPLKKVEAFYGELVDHYGSGDDREIRAASKLLLVALDVFRRHGGSHWMSLVDEYVMLIKRHPQKFDRIMKIQRGPE